ncbi:helix-turn-helix domain-containing protein [Haloprofundus sp. MHR1]|uniref:helix-turn-helix domain-containing protein n=1 Tax=Haloprofundus sp. MHR1 TaxID=2572921 RepID=UPI0010BF3331|nr:helix-turn-helix domain-containing protein [Haloprofundus sp. MHR1]QCJ46745.1 DNA-binding protein [Haloprofundus sp. MHR1]
MSTIAEVEFPADEFALRHALSSVPEAEFEVVRLAAHDADHVMPYVRVSGTDADTMTEALEADPSIENAELLDDLDDELLYRMNWVDNIRVIMHVLLDEGGTVMEMYGQGTRWHLRILFPTRDALSATHEFCTDKGLTFSIKNIYDLRQSTGRGEFGLTENQYTALVTAAERGYFDVPRDVTMSELAADLGVSQQALSERLRRGHKTLVESALRVGDSSFGDDS